MEFGMTHNILFAFTMNESNLPSIILVSDIRNSDTRKNHVYTQNEYMENSQLLLSFFRTLEK